MSVFSSTSANLYLAELRQIPGGINADEAAKVQDFFDETELSIVADWNDKSDNKRLRELQERSRAITLDKDRYFAVFESLRNAAFLLDHGGHLVNATKPRQDCFWARTLKPGISFICVPCAFARNRCKTLSTRL